MHFTRGKIIKINIREFFANYKSKVLFSIAANANQLVLLLNHD